MTDADLIALALACVAVETLTSKTADEVKADFARKGISPRSWAIANDLKPFVVYQLLRGIGRGTYGDSHRAAVLLGMKEGVIVDMADLKVALHPATDRRAA